MKIFCIIGFGRAGIDFFQSLLDNHPNISQFPGYFFYDIFWEEVKFQKNSKIIADHFIKNHERFFDSKKYLIERHNKLGKNKNESFRVSKNKFKDKFLELQKKISKLSVLINLHLAYSYASNENIENKKIIIINIHNFEHLLKLKDLKFKIFLMIRHPISSLSSGFKHWLNYSPKNVDNWFLFYQINRIFYLIKNCLSLKKKIYVIRLDLLHIENKNIIKKVSEILKIKFKNILTKSTYHGKKWWGDSLSKKYLDGVNKNFQDTYDKKLFFKKDISYLEFYLETFLQNYKFKKYSFTKNYYFYNFLPLKMELIIWKKVIFELNLIQIILIVVFWIKRIYIIQKFKKEKINYPILIK